MRKSILVLILAGCSLLADSKNYSITWTPNTDPDMDHYNLYVWSGLDTTQCPYYESMPISPTDATFYKAIPYTSSLGSEAWTGIADGKTYFSVLLQAADSSGNRSPAGWAYVKGTNSHFLLSPDLDPPVEPKDAQIE